MLPDLKALKVEIIPLLVQRHVSPGWCLWDRCAAAGGFDPAEHGEVVKAEGQFQRGGSRRRQKGFRASVEDQQPQSYNCFPAEKPEPDQL